MACGPQEQSHQGVRWEHLLAQAARPPARAHLQPADVEDLTQAAVWAFLDYVSRHPGDAVDPVSFVREESYALLFRFRRSAPRAPAQLRHHSWSSFAAISTPEPGVWGGGARRAVVLRAFLSTLRSTRTESIFKLRFLSGESEAYIATAMQLTPKEVSSTCRALLRQAYRFGRRNGGLTDALRTHGNASVDS